MELLVGFSDLNICGSQIRLAHNVKGHFENTEKTFFGSVKARESTENEDSKDGCVPFSEVVDGRFAGVFYTPPRPLGGRSAAPGPEGKRHSES